MTMTRPAVDRITVGRATAFTVELFTPEEIAKVTDAVWHVPGWLRHECWHEPRGNSLATIGEALYRNRDRLDYYTACARAENRALYSCFRLAHERVATFFEQRYGLPVVFAEQLAVPGFHVFEFDAPGSYEGGGWHIDILYTSVPFFKEHPDEVEAVVNFTVPFVLPDGGSGMDFENEGSVVTVPYAAGVMLFTEGEYRHRLAASQCHAAAQRRVTLQGHGVRFRDRWILFW